MAKSKNYNNNNNSSNNSKNNNSATGTTGSSTPNRRKTDHNSNNAAITNSSANGNNKKDNENPFSEKEMRMKEYEKKLREKGGKPENDGDPELSEEEIHQMLREIREEYVKKLEDEEAEKSYEESMLGKYSHKLNLDNEKQYREVIGCWLKTVSVSEFCEAIEKRVIGQEEVRRVCYNIYHYLELIAKGSRKSLPFILAAPSGCGKSETYRAVKDYFNKEMHFLSCIYVDASELTEAGFKGNNPETVVNGLLERPNSNGIGIVFLDEMDKKIIPSFSSSGQNVNAAVQHGLLTIIEGREVTASKVPHDTVNTNNTLFIAMGAFDFVREGKEEEKFISLGETKGKRDHFDGITREEMLEAGAGNELVGRFQSIINYHRLTEESVRKIVDLNIRELADEFDITISVEENVYSAMYAVSNGKFGCRLLKNTLRDRVQAMDMERKFGGKGDTPAVFVLDENGDRYEECVEHSA